MVRQCEVWAIRPKLLFFMFRAGGPPSHRCRSFWTGAGMVRKLLAVLTFAVAGLLMFAAVAAAAPPYPAPPVVTVNSAPAPASAANTATTLASTGAGFNVGATVLIAVIVLMLGVALVVLGRRLRRSNNH